MSHLTDVQKFIDASRQVKTARDLELLLDTACREMGFDHYALIHHVDLTPLDSSLTHMDSGSLLALTNYPESWVSTYVERNIVSNDPVLLASERTNTGFRWDEIDQVIPVTNEHRQITEETRRAGLVSGFTVPANVPGETNGSCSFAVREGRELPKDSLPMAQLIGAFAFNAARQLVHRARQKPIPGSKLTQRQLECLILVARGKSDWEIGRILGISEETVKSHLAAAREQYDVPKRIQVVMRAVYEGRLALSDVLH